MARRSTEGQAGFVITLELILIFTILGLGVMVGIVAIRNALFKLFLNKKSAEIYVVDSDPAGQKVLGKAFDLDEHEAPRLQFVDKDVTFPQANGVTVNRRVIVGVRDDRFTTRHRIFYENSLDCGATDLGGLPCGGNNVCQACIVRNGDETGDNRGVGLVSVDGVVTSSGTAIVGSGRITNGGGIGYLYPMQGGPSYGIGRELDSSAWRAAHPGLPGSLYRETDADCDPASIRSVWTSQAVTEGPLGSNTLPCEALPEGASVDAAKCPDGRNGAAIGDLCLPPADSRCVTADDGGGGLICACPPGWLDLGANCCPPGTVAGAPGQCTLANNGQIAAGTPVLDSTGANALALYEPPFRVNIPVDVDAATQASAPGGFEGAPPGAVLPGDTDLDSIDFATPATGGESGPP